MNSIELLAPAKNKTCAFAAINHGADAIYIAAENFGARKLAANSLLDLQEVINYAQKFNVKVYITLNTILNDDELQQAQALIEALEKIHADAIIIQDMGLLSLEHEIPFHASTQCDISTLQKAKFLENVGFKRIVLARELSLAQIEEIKQNTNLELEVFIHGALCVSYSGQCYLSKSIGARSANRGDCAQPCRKKYSLVDQNGNIIRENEHLLSLKDFNASKHIQKLAQLGVKSFKIEGRLKDESYVKNVVGYYRKLIDSLGLQKTSYGNVRLDFEPNPELSFNRGFTDYFLEKRKDCFSFKSVNSKGEFLGKVSKIGKNYFEANIKTTAQDGLWFETDGCLINKVENGKIYPNKMPNIKIGSKIFRTFNAEFERKLKNSKTRRVIPAKIEFGDKVINAWDEFGNCATVEYSFKETANNVEKMKQNIETAFKKSGSSVYEVNEVTFSTEEIPFLPISKLNELRRQVLETLEEREFSYPKQVLKPAPLAGTVDYRANILNKKSEEFYQACGCEVVEYAPEGGTSLEHKCVMRTKHCLKFACNLCGKDVKLFLVDEKGKKYSLQFNCDKCEMEIYP